MHGFPKTHQPPTRIADDTFVVHDHNGEGFAPVMVPLNTMVIRGAEPVVVDTGVVENRDQYLADVFGLVEPEDIRWVFVSHDDVDHTGNLNALMELAPNATLVTNWFMWERMGATLEVPLDRMRWIDDGESFSVGDRVLYAVRPPIFDSPTTRGLFDPTTGVYWASDSFGSGMPELVTHAEQLGRETWTQGLAQIHRWVSPWLSMVDEAKFQASVDRVQRLGVTSIAGCHAPIVEGPLVATAFEQVRAITSIEVEPWPGQVVLDELVAGLAPVAA